MEDNTDKENVTYKLTHKELEEVVCNALIASFEAAKNVLLEDLEIDVDALSDFREENKEN